MESRKQNNFTFIELLIVVAIIAIIAALLLPALNQARETQCLSNFKQIGTAYSSYLNDYGRICPVLT